MKGQTIALRGMGSLVLGFLLLLGASCTEDIIAEQQTAGGAASGDLVPVEFSVGDVANLTRATSSIVTFNANEQVKVCVKPNGQSSYTGYTYTTQSAGQTDIALRAPATPPYFPAGQGTSVEAYAYYPANTGTTFTVQANQTANNYYKLSDLMFAANRTITKDMNDGSNSLLMNHLMAQLHLNVTGQGVSINRVLVNCKRSVTFTPEAQTVVSTTGSADDIIAKTSSGDAYVLIPQQPINTVTVKVETGSQNDAVTTGTFTFTNTSDFVMGYSYTLNLVVTNEQVGGITTIEDWDSTEALTVVSYGGLDIGDIETQNYTGSAITPTPTVTCMGTTLTEGTDYELAYANNINAGTATVYAVGKSIYAGMVGTREFEIETFAGVINGMFTINGTGMQVLFSKGNLQATNTTANSTSGWTWAFAEHQWDYIGNATANNRIGNNVITAAGTVDLFCWVGNTSSLAAYGINNNTTASNYGSSTSDILKSDWGTLPITNGGNTANSGWFTLSKDEWIYLFNTRTASTVGGTANGRYAKATVNGVNGMILFPDSYTHPDGLTAPASVNSSSADYTANIYDATDWGKMETAGAVFLPAAGDRYRNIISNQEPTKMSGNYWSSTTSDRNIANTAGFSYYTTWVGSTDRCRGLSVRLVRPVE